MLALNMLFMTIVVIAIVGAGVWFVFLKPVTTKVVTICDKHDAQEKELAHYRTLAEKELEKELDFKGEEEQHIHNRLQ